MQRRTFHKLSLMVLLAPVAGAKAAVMPVKLDMTATDVVQLLGEPTRKGKEVEEPATGSDVQDWTYPKKGLVLKMSRGQKSEPQKVAAITASAPCPYQTDRGIALGDSAQKVKAAYKGKIDTEMSSAESIVVGSVYGGLIFSLKGGKVTRMFWGAAAE